MPDGRRVPIDLQNSEPAVDYIRTWLARNPWVMRNVATDRSPEAIANRIEVMDPQQPFGPPTTVVPSDVAAAMYGQKGDIALPSPKGSIAALRRKLK
jgi:hypothetical protein